MVRAIIAVTVADVAIAAGMSRQAIYNAARGGQLPNENDTAGQILIKLDDAIKFCVVRGHEAIDVRTTLEQRVKTRELRGAKAERPGNSAQRSAERFQTNVFGGKLPGGRYELGRLEKVRKALDDLLKSFHADHNKFSGDQALSVLVSVRAYTDDFCERVERTVKSKRLSLVE